MFAHHLFLAAALTLGKAEAPSDWLVGVPDGYCDATDVDFTDAKIGFATCAGGAAMTTSDGGASWHVFDTQLQQSLVYAHVENATQLYAARLGMYESEDGGATWQELGNLSARNDDSLFEAQFFSPDEIVALKGAEILRSTDGGSSWQLAYSEPSDVYFNQLKRGPRTNTVYASGGITHDFGSFGFVARSIDRGATWTLLTFPYAQITAADFVDDVNGLVATGNAFYATSDGGMSWLAVGTLSPGEYVLDIAHGSLEHWFAGTLGGCVYETTDSGKTWNSAYCDGRGRSISALYSSRSLPVVAVGNDGLVVAYKGIFQDGFESGK